MQRLADWLEPEYEKLKLEIRAAPRVHVDETGWPIDGRGGYLWGVTTPTQTLYHIDPSRGGKVIRPFYTRLATDYQPPRRVDSD